ncbi:MAG: rRNA maturation RNase YbeY [Deltaproteobacteria bacterium]|nr:rRNA maturation RNase YbeY [Deltaproteobacteria bacterium]
MAGIFRCEPLANLATPGETRYFQSMSVEITRRGAGTKYPTAALRKIAAGLLFELKQQRAELSIALVGDGEMRPLNRRYRKKNKTTDVLSFIIEDQPQSGLLLLGDVVISVEQARRQAKERHKTLKSEMVTLLIHGILHLLGYDHERSARQAKIMFALERKLQTRLCERGLLKV